MPRKMLRTHFFAPSQIGVKRFLTYFFGLCYITFGDEECNQRWSMQILIHKSASQDLNQLRTSRKTKILQRTWLNALAELLMKLEGKSLIPVLTNNFCQTFSEIYFYWATSVNILKIIKTNTWLPKTCFT